MPGFFGFLFGNSHHDRARRDEWRPSVIGKNAISPINHYGTCFSCEGTGRKTLGCGPCHGTGQHSGVCRGCQGSGRFERPALECFDCEGTGRFQGTPCRRCRGTGTHKPAISEDCRRCGGVGRFSETCRKCNGSRTFVVTCSKCEGSGWHKSRR